MNQTVFGTEIMSRIPGLLQKEQKRKRAEVTVLYGIVEKYVKNLCIRRRWVTREYERRKMRAHFLRRKNLRIKEVLDKNIW